MKHADRPPLVGDEQPERDMVEIDLDRYGEADLSPMIFVQSGKFTTVLTFEPLGENQSAHVDVLTIDDEGVPVESKYYVHPPEEVPQDPDL